MATALNLPRNHVVGGLVAVWSAADTYTTDGVIPGVGAAYVDEAALIDGFADAMVAVGWLKVRRRDITFPDWSAHNGPTAKTRAQAARRVSRSRNDDVAHAAQQKSNSRVTRADKSRVDKKRTAAAHADAADALLRAGVAEPTLTELAATGLTGRFIDYTAEKLSKRGLGAGALVHELRAHLAKQAVENEDLQRRKSRK